MELGMQSIKLAIHLAVGFYMRSCLFGLCKPVLSNPFAHSPPKKDKQVFNPCNTIRLHVSRVKGLMLFLVQEFKVSIIVEYFTQQDTRTILTKCSLHAQDL